MDGGCLPKMKIGTTKIYIKILEDDGNCQTQSARNHSFLDEVYGQNGAVCMSSLLCQTKEFSPSFGIQRNAEGSAPSFGQVDRAKNNNWKDLRDIDRRIPATPPGGNLPRLARSINNINPKTITELHVCPIDPSVYKHGIDLGFSIPHGRSHLNGACYG